MTVAKTDDHLSIQSDEYEWSSEDSLMLHGMLLPFMREWICTTAEPTLLDLGCGNGALTNELAKFTTRCVGTDMSKSGIAIATKNYPAAEFHVSAVDQPLPLELQHQFDNVVSSEVIEHLLLPRQLFERAKEALKPGGQLIISTPYHGYWKNLAIALAGKFDPHWHPLRDFGHVKFFSVATLSELATEQGFDVLEVKRIGRIPALARSMLLRARLKD